MSNKNVTELREVLQVAQNCAISKDWATDPTFSVKSWSILDLHMQQ
jgi:hypothetical protein